jgi:hypothetical protein
MRTGLLALLAALLVCAVGGRLQAANLLINPDFETVSLQHSSIFNGDNPHQVVQGWTTKGFNFVMLNDPNYLGTGASNSLTTADDYFDGAFVGNDSRTYAQTRTQGGGTFSLWGPDSTIGASNNGLTTSPTGGNFVAADGSYIARPITQTLSGLQVGQLYKLTFYWAAAQQAGFDGVTNEGWQVCLGTCAYSVKPNGAVEGLVFFNADPRAGANPGDGNNNRLVDPVNNYGYDPTDTSQLFFTNNVANANHGFVPWQFQYFEFTAQSDTQVLSLLAYGTPEGQPPFSLIDGLNLEAIPEPSTWAMMLIGFGVIGGVMRNRRTDPRGQKAQIV